MPAVIPTPGCAPVSQSVSFQARLVHLNGSGTTVTDEGAALQQTNISSITCNVYDLDSATPSVASSTPILVVASVISDTLVDDEIWTQDNIGRNFIHSVPGTSFTSANLYRIVYEATLSPALGSATITWVYGHQAISPTTADPYRASQDDVRALIGTDSSLNLIPYIVIANTVTDQVSSCATAKYATLRLAASFKSPV